ncbi:hypothetical protein CLAFUW4_05279 [Fulvia fulva]|uniref:Heterokaryon incompatibility domain-containing protein n=1 Tax=Passalora fulva TaxID=5499 RepID=A0A9Q8LK04_PASFU|nr:uncharacterized protein CLAFUR5_05426 [Fulvia fulva]KAK4623586.1 hypothetical protein CLAFUR4_05273 [Fulvia fulva]KAK4624900.1 hypothetical protein CLAFUR0_05280 [Fulvia fulva]UJO18113.1 hypothetical protein CLAFUR5_05426 [Fulvia fulva]WPV15156.1 hypothetical protein CLAFUW4_05279 [Fulvia fulva]WPV29994.1 hypothetical protein CLAFUW7_05278 [Fulvia fulva]
MEHTANHFRYTPLRKKCIRLVKFGSRTTHERIHLTLMENVSYDDTTLSENKRRKYIALSYCWGDPNGRVAIKLNGRNFEITRSLHAALVAIWAHHRVFDAYWIDAICIDQGNVRERNVQVARMWQIFRYATRVFAWLGDEDASMVSLARRFDCIHHQLPERLEAEPPGGDQWSTEDPIDFMVHTLLRNPYFSRTWILTEFTQAKRLDLVCGSMRCDFQHIDALLDMEEDTTVKRTNSAIHNRHRFSRFSKEYLTGRYDESKQLQALEDCIISYSMTSCQNPRDKVFAMLNHPSNTIRPRGSRARHLRPDYSMDEDELLVRTVAWINDTCEDFERGKEFQKGRHNEIDLGVNTPRIASYVVDALGVGTDVVDERAFDTWLVAHHDWVCLPCRIRLLDGTSVLRDQLLGTFLFSAARKLE